VPLVSRSVAIYRLGLALEGAIRLARRGAGKWGKVGALSNRHFSGPFPAPP